jgi:hypothetical protein
MKTSMNIPHLSPGIQSPMRKAHQFSRTGGWMLILLLALPLAARADKEGVVQCANVIYAGNRTSRCFSDAFLITLQQKSTIVTERRFKPVKLDSPELFDFPFVVMTGEGDFRLLQQERTNLAKYLQGGGFLLASAGCSSKEWDSAFRREMKTLLAEFPLKAIPLEHPLFRTVFQIEKLDLAKSSGTASIEGIEVNGKLVCVYSRHGLNDTQNSIGCCCCGGNEIRNSLEINANIVAYALLH